MQKIGSVNGNKGRIKGDGHDVCVNEGERSLGKRYYGLNKEEEFRKGRKSS